MSELDALVMNLKDIAKRARAASLDLATLSTEAKNRFLE